MDMKKINLADYKMDEDQIDSVPYEVCLDTESEMKIAQDVTGGAAKIYRNMSFDEGAYQTNQDSNLYEIIYEHKPVAFYIDFDAKRKDCNFSEEDVIKALDWIIEDFVDFYELPGVNGEIDSTYNIHKTKIVSEDLSGKTKN